VLQCPVPRHATQPHITMPSPVSRRPALYHNAQPHIITPSPVSQHPALYHDVQPCIMTPSPASRPRPPSTYSMTRQRWRRVWKEQNMPTTKGFSAKVRMSRSTKACSTWLRSSRFCLLIFFMAKRWRVAACRTRYTALPAQPPSCRATDPATPRTPGPRLRGSSPVGAVADEFDGLEVAFARRLLGPGDSAAALGGHGVTRGHGGMQGDTQGPSPGAHLSPLLRLRRVAPAAVGLLEMHHVCGDTGCHACAGTGGVTCAGTGGVTRVQRHGVSHVQGQGVSRVCSDTGCRMCSPRVQPPTRTPLQRSPRVRAPAAPHINSTQAPHDPRGHPVHAPTCMCSPATPTGARSPCTPRAPTLPCQAPHVRAPAHTCLPCACSHTHVQTPCPPRRRLHMRVPGKGSRASPSCPMM